MKVQIINKSKNELPEYKTIFSAGMDIKGDFSRISMINSKPEKFFYFADAVSIVYGKAKTIEILPGGRCLIPTGLFMAIPEGYEIQVRPRSGLALNMGITVVNSPGTIDADYRGELMVIVGNPSLLPVRLNDNERIAQIVLKKVEQIEWEEVLELPDTERGNGGFGHTGK